jgi:hypothetical protein
MKSMLISRILFCISFSFLTNFTFAEEPETAWEITQSGTTLTLSDGTGWVFKLTSQGVLSRSSSGTATVLNFRSCELPEGYEIKKFSSSQNSPFMGKSKVIQELYWPDTLTEITHSAFRECTALTICDFPENSKITSVQNLAFYKDAALVELTLVCDDLITIGPQAFDGASLKKLTIKAPNLKTVGTSAFNGNSQMVVNAEDIIPPSLTSIGNSAFKTCKKIAGKISLPNISGTLGTAAFHSCIGITEIEIVSEKLTAIGDTAFYGCTSCASVTLNCPNLTSIGGLAFSPAQTGEATNLKKLEYNCPKVTTFADGVFTGNAAVSIDIAKIIHPGVTRIGNNSFRYCRKMYGKVYLPKVTSIGSQAFYYAASIQEFETGETLASLGEHAVQYCSALTNVILRGSSLAKIAGCTFYQSKKIKRFELSAPLLSAVSVTSNGEAFNDVKPEKIYIHSAPFVSADGSLDNTQSVVDGILYAVSQVASTADKAKACNIYVPKENLADWKKYSSALLDYEPKHAPRRTFGVWRESSRKAYLVSLPQAVLGAAVYLR